MRRRCFDLYKEQPFANLCNITLEYPCLLADVDDPLNLRLNRPCIALERIADGHTDCFGKADERNTLLCNSYVLGQRFGCRNTDTICMPYALLCSSLFRCPEGDEAILCFFRRDSRCNGPNDVVCLNGECHRNARCNLTRECPDGEDEYWCHFNANGGEFVPSSYRQNRRYLLQSKQFLTIYLASPALVDSGQLHKRSLLSDVQTKFNIFRAQRQTRAAGLVSSDDMIIDKYLEKIRLDPREMLGIELPYICNRGIAIKGDDGRTHCLCSPSFYGEYCEFQADRISIATHIDLTHFDANYTIVPAREQSFLISCTFFFGLNAIDRHEFHVYPVFQQVKQKFYFAYPRTTSFREQRRARRKSTQLYSIRFQAFHLQPESKPNLFAVWYFPIEFDFLPAFRFAKVLRFNNKSQNYSCTNCAPHGKCFRLENEPSKAVCICENGWYGDLCEQYDGQCDLFCYSQALCRPRERGLINGDQRPACLCPLRRFGPTCHLAYPACEICQNGGSCYLTYDLSYVRPFACSCTEQFYGDYCQFPKRSTLLRIENTFPSTVLAMSLQYYDVKRNLADLFLREQQVFLGQPFEVRLAYQQQYAPSVILIKIYNQRHAWEEAAVHLVYSQQNAPPSFNKTVQLTRENQCRHTLTLFDSKTVKSKPTNLYFGFDSFHCEGTDLKALVFKYHDICHRQSHNRSSAICFRDDNYFCLCNATIERAQCLRFNPHSDKCQFCLSGGQCIRGSVHHEQDFICLCRPCIYGSVCQFSSHLFSVTLDALIIKDVEARQQLAIAIYVSIISLTFLVGVFSNLCSLLTFVRKNPRKVGVGNYLLFVSVVNLVSLILLSVKIIYILFGNAGLLAKSKTNQILCKSVSPLLSIFTRTNYWLTSLITIERLCTILFPSAKTIRKPRLAVGLSSITILLLFGAHIHEVLHYTVINAEPNQPNSSAALCVTDFEQQNWLLYNRINVLFHHYLPFIIQVISITVLIVLAARSRAKTVDKRATSFVQILKTQFKMQKELYTTPSIIVLSALPQIILTLSFGCTELNHAWQRYTLLIAYFFSFAPQIFSFGIHVLPSTSYRAEFVKTKIGMKLLSSLGARKPSVNARH